MRVDSLFLDEGFGTLDAESLDVGLEALAHRRGLQAVLLDHWHQGQRIEKMFFHDICGTGIAGNQIDPLTPFLEFLAIEEDAVGLMLRKRKAELV